MTRVYVDLLGAQETIDKLTGIGQRAHNARPVFEEIAHVLEQGEQRVFRGGKYHRTGRLEDSLTKTRDELAGGNADDAIRAAHADGQGLTFGTAVWYAHFQKDARGKSAVLKLQPKERKEASRLLMNWLTGGNA